ncbi:MAG TPA: MBL fold metallo-hydrolase [Chryseosolibacter sp.]|nr:MBL fold metallo-hydrolase [Chryseosolibacter sp.]
MVLVIVGLIAALPLIMMLIGISISGPRYKGPASDHFDGKKFLNPENVKAKGGLEVFKWMLSRKRGPWRPNLTENYGKHPLGHFKEGIRITFVNHSTFLIQVDGLNILTDPVWAHRVSPFKWAGPRRMKLPGIRFENLPKIHVVVLSHNHYDHLDIQTMRLVFGAHHPKVIAPLGVKAFLEQHYISGAEETDWWEELTLHNEMKIQAVPAQHFSGRGFLDRDATLWCGYVLKTSRGNIYFAGDTGYNEVTFKEIPSRCGPIKVALLPIGAYKPGWFMSPIHVSPEESVRIHFDVGSQTSIGMHFGTFPLADDGHDDPPNDLKIAIEKHQLGEEEFILLREGESRVIE